MKAVSAYAKSCCVYVKLPKIVQYMHGIIPYLFDSWADPVVHLLRHVGLGRRVAEWPDVELQISPIFHENCSKSGNHRFYLKRNIFKIFGLLLLEKLLPKTFKIDLSDHTGEQRLSKSCGLRLEIFIEAFRYSDSAIKLDKIKL